MRQRNTRHPQTEVKHELMAAFKRRRGPIIINGLARKASRLGSANFHSWFVHVDCGAYEGRYEGNTVDELLGRTPAKKAYGTPLLGIQALDEVTAQGKRRNLAIDTVAVLFEADSRIFDTLVRNLKDERYSDRLAVNPSTLVKRAGIINVVHGDYLDYRYPVKELLAQRHTFGFVSIDPYGARGLPYSFVQSLAELPHVDLMINFPLWDLYKKGRAFGADTLTTPANVKRIPAFDDMFGTEKWRNACREIIDGEDLERALAELYLDQLHAIDEHRNNREYRLVAKYLPLHFPTDDREIFLLYFVTHDPYGALVLNEEIWKAGLHERLRRWEMQQGLILARKQRKGQIHLPGDLAPAVNLVPPEPPKRIIDRQGLAELVWQKGIDHGRILTLHALYSALANQLFSQAEIDSALRDLRQANRCRFQGTLSKRTTLEFIQIADEMIAAQGELSA